MDEVFEKAAELQQIVPGAVLVGGSAAAHHAAHRRSFVHDHVVEDLAARFDTILEHLEALGDWTLARAQPGKIILGELGGIETGVRQTLRQRPLETERVEVRGRSLTVPTEQEILRVKAWLAVSRNQTRDYLDIAALADHMGVTAAAETLRHIDEYYADVNQRDEAVSSQVARQLADPKPRDPLVTRQLAAYKGLDPRWHDWESVGAVLRRVAVEMVS